MHHIVIDPEYQSLIPPLGQREYQDLVQGLLRDGCREPLSVTEDLDERGNVCYLLLDGHHRYRICERFKLPYETKLIHGLMSREEARQWIVRNQLGRRNLTPEQVAYYRGEQYTALRKDDGENLKKGRPSGSPVDQIDPPENTLGNKGLTQVAEMGTTAEQLAAKHNVSPGTIKRDAQYAEAVDRLVTFLGPEFRRRLLAHKTGLCRADVIALAAIEDRRLQAVARGKLDLKRCARTARRELAEEEAQRRPVQLELSFMDSWRSRLVEAQDAHENGDRDTVSCILAELLEQAEKVLQRDAD